MRDMQYREQRDQQYRVLLDQMAAFVREEIPRLLESKPLDGEKILRHYEPFWRIYRGEYPL